MLRAGGPTRHTGEGQYPRGLSFKPLLLRNKYIAMDAGLFFVCAPMLDTSMTI